MLSSYTLPARKTSANRSAVSPNATALISPPSASRSSTLNTFPSPLWLWYVLISGLFVTLARIVHRLLYGLSDEIGEIFAGASLRAVGPRPYAPYEGGGSPYPPPPPPRP